MWSNFMKKEKLNAKIHKYETYCIVDWLLQMVGLVSKYKRACAVQKVPRWNQNNGPFYRNLNCNDAAIFFFPQNKFSIKYLSIVENDVQSHLVGHVFALLMWPFGKFCHNYNNKCNVANGHNKQFQRTWYGD